MAFQPPMRATRIFTAIAVIAALALPFPATAQDEGLHDSSKAFSAPADLSWKDWDDPVELDRTWKAAIVRIPVAPGRSRQGTTDDLRRQGGKKYPTVIYLHGCSGIWPGTHRRMKFLSDNGFLVIAPASLARKTYPRSCNVETREGGLFRGTLVLRRNDAGHAIEMARQLSVVDGGKMVIMGFSEGAVAAVTFRAANERQRVRARVAEGWTCQAPWPEYRGIKAPESEPVLTLVGEADPWYQDRWTRGNCAEFQDPGNGSRSIVYRDGEMASSHGLREFDTAQKDVLDFLRARLDF